MDNQSGNTWRCTVCGYVHRGPKPPASCPVCGADALAFEPFDEPAESAAPAPQTQVKHWRCLICNYLHTAPQPPETCPLCGAAPDKFESQAGAAEAAAPATSATGHIAVVGGGIAGLSAAEAARQAAPQARITLISKETELPYYRLNLTRYLAGEVKREELPIHPASWYAEQRIELLRGMEAMRLDLSQPALELHGGGRLPFDQLILAGGAHPFVPPLPGAQSEGVTSFRSLSDADRILSAAKAGCRCVCVGGGLLGLETAGALARHGVDVTVLESFTHLMPFQLDPQAGALLAAHLARIGVKLRLAVHVKELAGAPRVSGVVLQEGGELLPADLVVLSTGVRPNSYLARQAGLNVKQGVIVDNKLRASHPRVFAAGDGAEHAGLLYGNWFVAQYQGTIAGMNAAGLEAEFGGVPRAHALKVLGLETFSIGRFKPQDGGDTVIAAEENGIYRSFLFRDGLLAGANLVGDARLAAVLKKALENKTDFSGLLARHASAAEVAEHLASLTTDEHR